MSGKRFLLVRITTIRLNYPITRLHCSTALRYRIGSLCYLIFPNLKYFASSLCTSRLRSALYAASSSSTGRVEHTCSMRPLIAKFLTGALTTGLRHVGQVNSGLLMPRSRRKTSVHDVRARPRSCTASMGGTKARMGCAAVGPAC